MIVSHTLLDELRILNGGPMKTYFVHNRDQDQDYLVVPETTVLKVTPRLLSEFLYAADLSGIESELQPGPPESFGEIVAVLEHDHLQILNQDLWDERRRDLDW
jgi:hypothetical protein